MNAQVALVMEALRLLWNRDTTRCHPRQRAAISAIFWHQDPSVISVLLPYYRTGFDIATIARTITFFEGDHGRARIVRAFDSFSRALLHKGVFTENDVRRLVNPISTPTRGATPTRGVTATSRTRRKFQGRTECVFCRTDLKVPRKKGTVVDCPGCGLKLRVAVATKTKLQLKPVAGGTQSKPLTLAQGYKTLGVPRHATFEEIKEARLRRLKLCHPDKFHNRSKELQAISATVTRNVLHAFEMIESNFRIAK